MESLEHWDDFVKSRYSADNKAETEFRDYRSGANPGVEEFYRQNHAHQTLDFVLAKKAEYTLALTKRRMGIWDALEYLNHPR